MIGTHTMGTTDQARSRAEALAHTDEPTADMLAASAAEVVEPAPVALGPSEELSGGAGAMYLREIANHDLLNAQDEIQLAQRMEAGREAARRLESGEHIDGAEYARLQRVVEDGEQARRHLIECNLRLVVSVVRRYLNRGLSFLDLVQEGNIGLQIGADKYDWRRGFRFSTYVYWWIRQAMTRSLADQSRTIRLPVHAVALLTRVMRVERTMQAETGELPSVEVIADHLGLDVERIIEARRAAQTPLWIEAPLNEDSDLTRGHMPGDEVAAHAAHREVEKQELSRSLSAALATLDARERRVIEMRFGLARAEA